ncbi:MAG: hypothetical protein HQL53_13850 [Magnetococcales bacterium]|nr:hypothetical protein [Magnetococcales bacterium]
MSLVGSLYALFLFVNADKFRPVIIQRLTHILAHPVTLDRVRISPTSGLVTLELENFQVHSLDPSEPPLLQAPTALLGIGPSFVLKHYLSEDRSKLDPNITSITLVSPQINLVQRNSKPLLERAQDSARVSHDKMERVYGKGLTGMAVEAIEIRDGILTVLNWEHPDGQTLIFDHLQLDVRDLSPHGPSPLSASARFQLIPFKVLGQIGPLPESLDPFEMPIRLNVDAKSAGLRHLSSLFRTLFVEMTASKGSFSTMLNGSLKHGLQTTSWLELKKLVLTPLEESEDRQKIQRRASHSTVKDVQTPSSGEREPVDLAMRQKSMVELKDGVPTLTIQESYIYLDDEPKLDVKGTARMGKKEKLDLTINILEPIDVRQIPVSIPHPISSGTIGGHMDINGDWPDSFNLSIDLDLTDTLISGPAPFHKEPGTPFSISALLIMEGGMFGFEQATVARISGELPTENLAEVSEHNFLKITGVLQPQVDLRLIGEWDLEYLTELTTLAPKGAAGIINMDLIWSEARRDTLNGSIKLGALPLGRFNLRDISSEIRIDAAGRIHLSRTKARVAQGQVDLEAMISFSPKPSYQAIFSMTGLSLGKLLEQVEQKEASLLDRLTEDEDSMKHASHLQGHLYGIGSARGFMDDAFRIVSPLSGSAWIRVEPGRLVGIDPKRFLEPVTETSPLFKPASSFDWSRGTAFVSFLDRMIYFESLDLEAGGLSIRGHGQRSKSGSYDLNLAIASEWNQNADAPERFRVEGASWEALTISPTPTAEAPITSKGEEASISSSVVPSSRAVGSDQ